MHKHQLCGQGIYVGKKVFAFGEAETNAQEYQMKSAVVTECYRVSFFSTNSVFCLPAFASPPFFPAVSSVAFMCAKMLLILPHQLQIQITFFLLFFFLKRKHFVLPNKINFFLISNMLIVNNKKTFLINSTENEVK